MSQPSIDANAVVRAFDGLTAQVRRIADGMQTPVAEGKVRADDGATTCSAQHRRFDDGRLCIRAAQHHGDHIDERGFHWSDTVALYPIVDAFGYAERERTGRNAGLTIPRQSPDPADERRDARRDSIRNLLDRADRNHWLLPKETVLLRQHVESEMRVSDQLRAGRETWKTKAEEIEQDRDRSDEAARRALEQRQEMAEERYAWQERGDKAEAAIVRVRGVLPFVEKVIAQSGPGVATSAVRAVADRLRAALDGTEQPGTDHTKEH